MILKNTTGHYCLNCLKKRSVSPLRKRIEKEPVLCDDCLHSLKKDLVKDSRFNTDILFLSSYDGLRKERLRKYKEYGDIVLSKAFLYYYLPWVKLLFFSYIIVPLPSSDKRNEERGFIHLEERLKAVKLPYLSCLKKTSAKEQKEKNASERRRGKDIIFAGKREDVEGKRILLFDDVFTSGSTFRNSLEAIRKENPKKVKGLILRDNFKSNLKLEG